ncbi:hypothetical protein RZR97_00730 [Hydrogenimonas thermophila]|uniref:hypothetical protein n=1 Tax=Hydrogenimonas thermophila TaxID=223786 RepID=UPI002936E649|nr:hypothetical protein [Hydrogenimonas thermophila]WOE70120.1 hypothetical protein RZR91_00730 [Hydrogenimonas thermophila]WOE72637.1 hypothetical protein RZR97_00730 [Hydrogenimonas thermophila]
MNQTEIKKIVKSITIEGVKDELHQLKVIGQKFDEAINNDDNEKLIDELLNQSDLIVQSIIKKITPTGFVAKELPNPVNSWEIMDIVFYDNYRILNSDKNSEKALFAVTITSCDEMSHAIRIKNKDLSYWEELK